MRKTKRKSCDFKYDQFYTHLVSLFAKNFRHRCCISREIRETIFENLRVLLHTKATSRPLFHENIVFLEDSLKNVLIITKEIMSMKESVYVIKISANLYKL